MPAIGFICPDKVKTTFQECFSSCRLAAELPCGRCKALPFLRKAASQREWTGEPSTTQLLQGTREAWLKITRPYYVDPDDLAYRILGTSTHAVLEKLGDGDSLTEERLRDNICSGAFDFYDGETQTLIDYKTWGSYKIMQALGITYTQVVETDDSGNPVLKKSGKNKGEPKTKKVWSSGDIALKATAMLETSIQLSNYRDKLLRVLPDGYYILNLAVQAISRDGGLMVSLRRGIEEKAPLIPINGISKHWVDRYLSHKKQLLMEALEKDCAAVCRKRERWYGKKCGQYCEVNEHCFGMSGWEDLKKPELEKLVA